MEVQSAHTRLFVDDIAACAQFYQDVLKFEPIALHIEKGYAEFEITKSVRVSLFRRQEMSEILRTSNLPVADDAQDKVGLILHVHDLDSIYHELREAGVTFAEPPTQNNEFALKVAYFRDPADTLIGLFEPMM